MIVIVVGLFPEISRAEDCYQPHDMYSFLETGYLQAGTPGKCFQSVAEATAALMNAANSFWSKPNCFYGYDGYCYVLSRFSPVPLREGLKNAYPVRTSQFC